MRVEVETNSFDTTSRKYLSPKSICQYKLTTKMSFRYLLGRTLGAVFGNYEVVKKPLFKNIISGIYIFLFRAKTFRYKFQDPFYPYLSVSLLEGDDNPLSLLVGAVSQHVDDGLFVGPEPLHSLAEQSGVRRGVKVSDHANGGAVLWRAKYYFN